MNTAQKLSDWIERSGQTRASFADRLGYSRSSITLWCTGQRRPMRNAAKAIEVATKGSISASDWGYLPPNSSPGARLLQQFLLKRGLSASAGAELIGVDPMSMRRWLSDQNTPTPSSCQILSKALQKTLTPADFA